MDVVIVDARDVRVGYDDEREVAKGLDSVGKTDGKEGESEVCGGEQSGCGKWGTAMSSIGSYVSG